MAHADRGSRAPMLALLALAACGRAFARVGGGEPATVSGAPARRGDRATHVRARTRYHARPMGPHVDRGHWKMARTLALMVLLTGCGSSDPPPSSPAPTAGEDPAPSAAEEPSAEATPGALQWRSIDPYRMRAEITQPTARAFADQAELEAGSIATAVMGQTYTPPDFAAEHVIGVVLPESPAGTELTVDGVALDEDGVITVTCSVTRASGSASYSVQPSVVLGISRAPGARSIVVLVDGQRAADLPVR